MFCRGQSDPCTVIAALLQRLLLSFTNDLKKKLYIFLLWSPRETGGEKDIWGEVLCSRVGLFKLLGILDGAGLGAEEFWLVGHTCSILHFGSPAPVRVTACVSFVFFLWAFWKKWGKRRKVSRKKKVTGWNHRQGCFHPNIGLRNNRCCSSLSPSPSKITWTCRYVFFLSYDTAKDRQTGVIQPKDLRFLYLQYFGSHGDWTRYPSRVSIHARLSLPPSINLHCCDATYKLKKKSA